jgi:linoleoyl-CoA desaturase
VEHHLFSKVCSVHYPQIHPLVRSIAHKHGVPYNEAPTFRQAVISHLHMLDRLGKPPLKVVSN